MTEHTLKAGLILQAQLPKDWIEEFESTLDLGGEDFEVRENFSGPMAGVMIYLPQAVMVFFASAYFGAMLAEMGKDHYSALKKASKRLWRKVRPIEVTAVGPEAKIQDSRRFQLAFSLIGQTSTGETYKLLIQRDTSETLAEEGIDKFIELVGLLCADSANEEALQMLDSCKSVAGVRVLTVDCTSGDLIPADPK